MRDFIYGQYKYKYELIHQERKTLSLVVRPDMTIILKCPFHADDDRINSFLKRKWKWLEKQLQFFKKFPRKVYKREYVSGESFMYLGRQYQLIVKKAKEDMVSLTNGKLLLHTKNIVTDCAHKKKLIERWFKKRAEIIFHERFQEVKTYFHNSDDINLSIRKMNKRWGSFYRKNRIILNPQLIHAPKYCIDYVLTHELSHLKYVNHDKRFYAFLSRVMPDWKDRKEKLEKFGIFKYIR